jgi:hypothetical protein
VGGVSMRPSRSAAVIYRECNRCGATVIELRHYVTNSNIEIDPLPVKEGNIIPDFVLDKCSLVRKHRSGLWQAHVASCPAFHQLQEV